MVADDLGVGDISSFGSTLLRTPNIDRIAEQGMLASNAKSTASVCTPSRFALLTGRFYTRYAGEWNGQSLVEEGRPTIATELRKAGYATGYFGKYHLGWGDAFPGRKHRQDIDWNKELPRGVLEMGYDTYFGTPFSHNEPPFVFVQDRHVVGLDPSEPPLRILMGEAAKQSGVRDNGWGVSVGAPSAHAARPVEQIDAITTQKAIEFIAANKDRPFYINMNFVAPHTPIAPSKEFQGRSRAGPYGDYVEEMDYRVGEILDALDAHGLSRNTLVIFTSDNGAVYDRGAYAKGLRSNKALQGQKTDAWDGGVSVPFVTKLPGRIPAGMRSDFLISLVDMPKTIWSMAGVPFPENTAEDSMDLSDIFLGRTKEPIRTELFQIAIFGQGLRYGPWVYLPDQGSLGVTTNEKMRWAMQMSEMDTEHSDYVNGRLKADAPKRQLYHIERDPNQTKNVILEYPEVAERLEQRLIKYQNMKKSLWK